MKAPHSAANAESDAPFENEELKVRAYLEANIMPTLVEALQKLSSEKAEDPIEFLAKYMLEHNPNTK